MGILSQQFYRMKTAFIQTYPIYHDLIDTTEWLDRINRDRWMPGIMAQMGIEVELWAADYESSTHISEIDGFGDYPMRLFEVNSTSGQSKKHYSSRLIRYAQEYDADLHILKGVDGGVGIQLLKKYLLPENKPFVFIIGGKYYTGQVPKADLIFYETEEQKQKLTNPGLQLWRKQIPEEKLMHLPKSVDTELFRPMPGIKKKWDIICVGRLIHRYKSYDALGVLAEHFNVSVVGGGPAREDFEKKYPQITWLGQVPNSRVPEFLNESHTFMHPGVNDYFPRVIPEAAACGCVLLAFSNGLDSDVIPPDCGLRLDEDSYIREIESLLENKDKIQEMSENARSYAVNSLHKYSTREPLKKMLKKMGFKTYDNV